MFFLLPPNILHQNESKNRPGDSRLYLLDDVAKPVVIDSLLKHPRRVGRQHRTGNDVAARRVLASGGSDDGRHQDTQDDLA